MKTFRTYIFLSLASIGLVISSCSSFLDRPPTDRVAAGQYFSTVHSLQVYVNRFYDFLPTESLYEQDAASDNIVPANPKPRVTGSRLVPTSQTSGGWSWHQLRDVNFFLANYQKVQDEDAKHKYSGIARFFRAYLYFKKVRRFGDVPWYSKPHQAGDSALYKPRDPRKLVMDSVLVDIDYAIENIPASVELYRITKYTALALKARICLFEGTFREYHDLGDYKKFLKQAVKASKTLIESGAYSIYTKGGPDEAYRNLFAMNSQVPTETILARNYNPDYNKHSLGYRLTSPTFGTYGMPKDLINTYLMKKGGRFTAQSGYKTMTFNEEMQNRDPRLTQTTAGPDFKYFQSGINLDMTSTGYRIIKGLPLSKDQWSSNSSYNDIIIFRYGETLLIYAEAKAELGTLTQHDLDISINKLRDRVDMPHLKLADANAHPDPQLEKMYPHVNDGPNEGVILEIRRERRIELFFEGRRWWDLMRWKEGDRVEQPMVGIYFPHLGGYDFNGDGKTDVYVYNGNSSSVPDGAYGIDIQNKHLTNGTSGNLDPFPGSGKFYPDRGYYYPIPIEAIQLNPNLKQNPGWEGR